MKQRFLIPLLLLIPSLLSAQRFGILSGRIIGPDKLPVANAAVEILRTSPRLGSYSRKEDGAFRISRLLPGSYDVVATLRGVSISDTISVRIGRGTTRTLDIAATPMNSNLDGSLDLKGEWAAALSDVTEMRSLSSTATAPFFDSPVSIRGGRASETSIEDDRVSVSSGDTARVANQPKPRPGQLTAGEWSDLDQWEFWNDMISDSSWSRLVTHWGYEGSRRVTVWLRDGNRAIIDGELRLVDGDGGEVWRARTDNHGRAELFADAKGNGYRLDVWSHGGFISAGSVTPGSTMPRIIQLPGERTRRDELDMMFVVDATGSMGDEMDYIKTELEDVIERIRETSSDDLRIRLGSTFYRDESDADVVTPFPFSESTFDMIGHIRDQYASGGGDFEEAVEIGLEDAIDKHEWSAKARARLLFMVLDAPPHYTPDRLKKLHDLTARAAARGIRIIPIASSGTNKDTEFLLRLFSIHTGGTYLFLTDDSGIGGGHLKPTIGKHEVAFLNDLMVRVIARYLDDNAPSADALMEGMGLH